MDARLLRHAPGARAGVAGLVVLGLLQALLALAGVGAATLLVVAVVGDDPAGTAIALLTAALAGRALVGWAQQVVAARTAARVGEEVREAVLAAVLRRGPAWAAREGTGRLAALATSGPDALRPWFTGYLPTLVLATVLPGAVVVLMAFADPLSALITALTLPLVPLFGALVGWATRRRAAERVEAGVRLSGHFLDVVRGLPTLRLFGRAERQVDAVRETTARHREATMRVLRVAFLSSTALDLVATLSVGLVAVEAGLRVAGGTLDLAPALLVILLAPEAHRPLRQVGARFHAAADAGAVVDVLDAVLGDLPDDAPREAASAAPGAAVVGVQVRHEGAWLDALVLPALAVRPGEIVALSGPSGAGKTTALRVLAGVQAVSAGAVEVSGPRPVHLPQRPMLPYVRTVAEALDPAPDDPARWEALRAVGLDAEVAALPGRLGHPLGENGRGLSSGQRQRLALARVLARARREPVLLLLDEPTAHLDAAAEQRVLDELRAAAARGCAVLLSAHRPAVLAFADRVVTLLPPPSPRPLPHTEEVGHATPAMGAPPGPRGAGGPVPSSSVCGKGGGGRGRVTGGAVVAVGVGVAAWGAGIVLTGAAAWLLVRASTLPPVLSLSAAVVTVRASAVARPLLRYLERLVSHEVALARLGEWRSQVYADLVPAVRLRRGDLLTRVVDDVDARVDGLLRGRFPALAAAITALLAIGAAALVLPGVAAVLAVAVLLAGGLVPALASRAAARQDVMPARVQVGDAAVETVEAVEELAALDPAEALVPPRLRIRALRRVEVRQAWSAGLYDAVGGLVWAGAPAVTAVLVAASRLGPEVSAVVVLGVLALGEPVATFPEAAVARRRGRAAVARLRTVRVVDEVHDHETVQDHEEVHDRDGSVRVEGLVAGWGDRAALRGVDLVVPAGGRVAVVGVSGSGKSTLAAVLVGLLAPTGGTVRAGRACLVGDDVDHVFASTLRENLRLARPGADDQELRRSLRDAALGGWLESLPRGLDTWLGEGGSTISGGQQRRLAMARALLADPELLVLDEPTEGLAEATAEALVTDLLAASAGRTVVLLTHRREGLDLVDAVHELHDGRLRVLESGRLAR